MPRSVLPPGFNAAALVAALSTGSVSACDALCRTCDLSVLPPEADAIAHGHHASALALAANGAVAALRGVLLAAEGEGHQRLIKSSLEAIRAVLNSGFIASVGRGDPGAQAVMSVAVGELYPPDGSGCALLLRIVEKNPSREVAFAAFRIARLTHMRLGWTAALAPCTEPAALEALLILGGSFIDPRCASDAALLMGTACLPASCAPRRMSPSCEMLWPLQFIITALACNRSMVASRLGALPLFWPLLHAQFLKADNTLGQQQIAMERLARNDLLARPQLDASVTSAAALLAALVIRHGDAAAQPPKAMAPVILAACCANLTASPNDTNVAELVTALVAARPDIVAEALKFDLKTSLLRQMASISNANAPVAAALRALASPPDTAPLMAALMPMALRPAGVTPASPAAVSSLDTERERRERVAYRTAEATTAAEDDAEAAAAPLPLWRAAQAASTGRGRIALARASTVLRACELRRKRSEMFVAHALTSATTAIQNVIMAPPGARPGAPADPTGFVFTLGLQHILGGPELAVLADLPDMSVDLQNLMIQFIITEAGYAVTKAISCPKDDGDEREAAARLCRRELVLPDAQCGIFASRMELGFMCPSLLRSNGAVQLPEALCREAGQAMVWRFLPREEALRAYAGRTWCGGSGVLAGRATSVYYADQEGQAGKATAQTLPLLVCSLAACFAKLPKKTAQKVLSGMHAGVAGAPRSKIFRPAPEAMAGYSPALAALAAERKAQQTFSPFTSDEDSLDARRRSRMECCGLVGCDKKLGLKQCGACRKIAYCCPEHQKADWKLGHKAQCAAMRDGAPPPPRPTPAAAAQAAAAVATHVAEDEAALAALSVRELRARVEAQGLDGSACIEKADLVRLLQGARIQDAMPQ